MKKMTRTSVVAGVMALAFSVGFAMAQEAPTIRFDNQSGEAALVKLIGPTELQVGVPDGSSRAVQAAGGRYYILCRYGAVGHFHYTKGAPFDVVQNSYEVSEIEITLHKVANGNYHTREIPPAEFGK